MRALFEKAGVVDLPGFDRLARGQCVDGISRRAEAQLTIAPGRFCNEVLQLLMDGTHPLNIRAAAGGNGSMLFRSASLNSPHA